MSSTKVINIITSLISLISLEIVLIPTFGVNNVEFFKIMVIVTGGGIALVITIISLYMIINSTEWLKENNLIIDIDNKVKYHFQINQQNKNEHIIKINKNIYYL